MFSKSRRFDDKKEGCGADALYDVKKETKLIGGVISKSGRFDKLEKSDTESVKSDKSSIGIFRTPKSVKHNILHSAKKNLTSTKSCSNLQCNKTILNDIVNSKEVEIRNKDATILECEQQIKELTEKINVLKEEITSYKEKYEAAKNELSKKPTIQSPERKLNDLSENLALVKSHHALALEANETIRHEYRKEIESVKTKYEEDIQRITNNYKSKVEEIENEHEIDLENLTLEFNEKMKLLDNDYTSQIKMMEEKSVENVKICEIQYEERIQELKTYTDSLLNLEKEKWQRELEKCQASAENEIIKFELQILDLKQQLQVSSDNVKDLSNSVSALQKTIDSKEIQLNEAYLKMHTIENASNDQNSMFTEEIERLSREINQLNNDKNRYSLILDSTKNTVDMLSMRLKSSDENVESLTEELEICKNKLEQNTNEYNQLLLSIIKSKAAMDESHKNILENNQELSDNLAKMESDIVSQIENIKDHLDRDVNSFKMQSLIVIEDLEEKYKSKCNEYAQVKELYDEAYNTISECKTLITNADNQLEYKEQEVSELETEINRITGVLAAVEQERNELQALLLEFNLLIVRKDQKLNQYLEENQQGEEKINDLEEQLKKISELLEATEYIMKEKESENSYLKDEVNKLYNMKEEYKSQITQLNAQLDECEAQNNELLMKHAYEKDLLQEDIKKLNNQIKDKCDAISDLEHDISQHNEKKNEYDMHMKCCNMQSLEAENAKLQTDLTEVTTKYTDLLGHQNYKQKIKHVIDLKSQNNSLREENDKLKNITQKQAAQIEKLKKELEAHNMKSPRKTLLSITTPKGKENSPLGKSPKLVASPLMERPSFPLKEINL